MSDRQNHIKCNFIGVVDDGKKTLLTLFTESLKRLEGYSVFGFSGFRNLVLNHIYSQINLTTVLLLCDLRISGMTGIELLRESKKVNPSIVCMLMSAFGPNR